MRCIGAQVLVNPGKPSASPRLRRLCVLFLNTVSVCFAFRRELLYIIVFSTGEHKPLIDYHEKYLRERSFFMPTLRGFDVLFGLF